MMVRVDFEGRSRPAARALRAALAPGDGVTLLAEPGPRLPFRDHAVDEVFLGSMIAWRGDIAETLDELWRVCKPGALVHMTLPHASSVISQSRDANPRPMLTLNTFNYYDPRTKPWDAPQTAFSVERGYLRVAGARAEGAGLALARGPFASFIEKVANGSRGSQYRFERWASGLVAFEEFDVVLSVIKPADVARTAPHSAGASVAHNGHGDRERGA
jgi:SAM-dependent methyltransferase